MAYSVIERHIWHDEKFRQLSRDAREVFLYLLTSPHSNRLGMYVLDCYYAASDVQMEPDRVEAALAELKEAGRIDYDTRNRLVFIKRFLKHNPLRNPNVVTAACGDLATLPYCEQLWQQLADALKRWSRRHYEPLRESLRESLGDKTLNQDPIQEQDPIPEPTTTSDKSLDGEPSNEIHKISSIGERQQAYLQTFMPMLREVGLGTDDTNGSILKAIAGKAVPAGDVEAVIRGLPLLPSVAEMDGGELRFVYAKDQPGEPAWNRAKRAYYDSQKGVVSDVVKAAS